MEQSIQTINIINPVMGRHVPFYVNNNIIIEKNLLLLLDQQDNSICACTTTKNNLLFFGLNPMLAETDLSVSLNLTDSDSHTVDTNNDAKTSTINCKTERWSKDATLFLIDQWQKNSLKFASTTIRNEEVWKHIVKELEDAGFPKYTWKQAEDKWKNLRKAYMKVKDNESDKNSGAARITCKFYDELNEIFKKSPSVQPISIASSSNCKRLPITDVESDSDFNSEKDFKCKFKKKKTKMERDTLAWLSILKEDAAQREATQEKRHEETLNVLKKAVDTYEIQMQKLIDKL